MDETRISNIALGFLGRNPITTFDDGTVESNACSINYEPARDFCLEQRDWTFAASRSRLTPLTSTPISEYDYNFPYPPDCLVLRAVSSDVSMKPLVKYSVDEESIATNHAIIYIRYTKRVSDPSKFSPSFIIAIAHKMAELMAVTLTANINLKVGYEIGTANLLEQGGAIDGMQGSPRQATASKLLKARHGSFSHGGQIIHDWGY